MKLPLVLKLSIIALLSLPIYGDYESFSQESESQTESGLDCQACCNQGRFVSGECCKQCNGCTLYRDEAASECNDYPK